jgi:hypothetical protein
VKRSARVLRAVHGHGDDVERHAEPRAERFTRAAEVGSSGLQAVIDVQRAHAQGADRPLCKRRQQTRGVGPSAQRNRQTRGRRRHSRVEHRFEHCIERDSRITHARLRADDYASRASLNTPNPRTRA